DPPLRRERVVGGEPIFRRRADMLVGSLTSPVFRRQINLRTRKETTSVVYRDPAGASRSTPRKIAK
ncbi:MAG: hypothetical protein ACYTG0_29670, partial [Planctomycetota bacterium]